MTLPHPAPSWYSSLSATYHERLVQQVKNDLVQAVTKLINSKYPEFQDATSVSIRTTPSLRKVTAVFFDASGSPVGEEIDQDHPLIKEMAENGMLQTIVALYPDQDLPLGLGSEITEVDTTRVPVHVKDTTSDRWKIYASHPKHLQGARVYLVIPLYARYREKLQAGRKVVPHINVERKVLGLEILPENTDAEDALMIHAHAASLRIDISRSINWMGLRPAIGAWALPDPVFDEAHNQILLDFSTMPEITPEQWAEVQEIRRKWAEERRAQKPFDRRKLKRKQAVVSEVQA